MGIDREYHDRIAADDRQHQQEQRAEFSANDGRHDGGEEEEAVSAQTTGTAPADLPKCPSCGGDGGALDAQGDDRLCPDCKGSGEVVVVARDDERHVSPAEVQP